MLPARSPIDVLSAATQPSPRKPTGKLVMAHRGLFERSTTFASTLRGLMIRLSFVKSTAATAVALLLLTSASAFAQVSSTAGTDVSLTATLQETLTVALDQTAVTFALTSASATNPGNVPVVATTSWILGAGRTDVKLYAYFDSPTAALSLGAVDIASAQVSASVGGTSVGTFSNVIPVGANGVTIFDTAITDANRTSSHVSSVTLNIDLTSTPQLPAGAYAGTLHFQAQATT
jgi:hypothetical protein